MTNSTTIPVSVQASEKMDWSPIITIALAQILIAANIATLSISIGAIVTAFHTSTVSIQSAMVVYSLVTAAAMILGGKLGALFGSLRIFRVAVLVYGLGMAAIALSVNPTMLILSEAVAGLAAAILVPSLIALVAANYSGKQQTLALGVLGAAGGIGGSAAMLLAGFIGTAFGWQIPFWLIVAVAAIVLVLSPKLKAPERRSGVTIDWLGVLLSGLAILLLTLGVNFVGTWGFLLAKPAAPFSLFGLSPSFMMIIAGILAGGVFFSWQNRRVERKSTPLLSPEVIDSHIERMTLVTVLLITCVGSGLNFLLPLYNQIVQGSNGIGTAVAMLPYTLSLFAGAILVTRLIGRLSIRQIVRYCILLMAGGLLLLGIAIQNEWSNLFVVLGLISFGAGMGAVMTILSNVLVSASPAELAGEVGGLRGTTNNLGGAIGTALAGVILTISLAGALGNGLIDSTVISTPLKESVNLDNAAFVSNNQLAGALVEMGVTGAEADEAVRINSEARLQALKVTFFFLSGLGLLGLLFTGSLPTTVQDPGAAAKPAAKKASARR